MNDLELSRAIEDALVARNPRGMRTLQAAMTPGSPEQEGGGAKGQSPFPPSPPD